MNGLNRKIGFFPALWGCCRGTGIFFALRYQSWPRLIGHLLLLALLCSFGITLGERSRFRPGMERALASFETLFGEIRLAPEGITPTLDPSKARSLPLPGNGFLLYAPDLDEGVTLGESDAQLLNYLLVWSPRLLLSGARTPGGDWQVWSKRAERAGRNPLSYGPVQFGLTSAAALPEYLKSLRPPAGTWEIDEEETYPAAAFFDAVGFLFLLTLFAGYTVLLTATAFFCTGIFTLVFRFVSVRQLRVLTIRELWKVGIYAGFPATIIASFFPALELPLFSYSTVYMFGLVVYWMVVLNRIERSGNEEDKGNE